jgi:hypothetical protein
VVDQGGTPSLNQSIAFGLSPGTSITTIRLTVAPRSGDPRDITLQAQGVTFQAFVGANPGVNLTAWSAVPVLSVTPPTAVNSYFEITLGATSGTFLKVHVAGDTQQPVLPPLTATAVTALSPAAAGGGSTKVQTRNLLQFFNGSLTGTPIRDLTLGANASFSFNDQDPAGRQDTSGNYSFTATGTPHRLLTVIGIYQGGLTSSSDPATQDTASHNGSLTLSSTPLPTLTSALSGNWSQTEVGGQRQNQVVNVSLNNALVPYRNLNVDFTVSGSEARSFVDDTRSQLFSFNLNANTTLTPQLTGLFTYTLSTGEVEGPLTTNNFMSNSGFLSLTYTVSRFLDVNGRWDITVTERNQILTQAYRLNLRPTEKTSLILGYLRTDQWGEGAGGSTNVVSANATWNISRYFDLSALGSFTRTPSGDSVYTVSSTLSFRL